MRLGALVVIVLVCAAALDARAAGGSVLIVRGKGPQLDEAVLAIKREIPGATTLDIDESTSVDVLASKAAGASVIVGVGARAVQLALKQSAVPVVHCMVLTDAQTFDTERSVGVPLALPAKAQLAALLRVAPAAKRIGLLYDPKLNARFESDANDAARALGVALVPRAINAATDAPQALDDIVGHVDALLLAPDATVATKEFLTFLVARAFDKKLPVLAFSESLAKLGLLAALAPSYAQNGKLCAGLAERVAAGDKPATLKGTALMTGSLVVNVSTARRIGVSLAPDLLRAPTEVVGQ